MSKKPATKNVIENLNLEIDYDKLAKALLNADAEGTICRAIISAHKADLKAKKEEERKLNEERAINFRKALKVEDCFCENGTEIRRGKSVKLFFRFLFAKNRALKDVEIIPPFVSGAAASFFGLIEWVFYIVSAISLFLCGKAIYTMIVSHAATPELIKQSIQGFIYAVTLFLLARTVVRMIKIECTYSKDKNYMISFVTMIIGIVALIIAVVVK